MINRTFIDHIIGTATFTKLKFVKEYTKTILRTRLSNKHTNIYTICVTSCYLLSFGAFAQPADLSKLRGNSIIAEYEETITSRRGAEFRQTWRDRIYISTLGRIFHKFDRQSSRPGRNRDFEALSDTSTPGSPRDRKYQWSKEGLSRQWISRRGTPVRQSIIFSQDSEGLKCRMLIDYGSARWFSRPVWQSCRVVNGNILAGN